jgi:hypothetical protein
MEMSRKRADLDGVPTWVNVADCQFSLAAGKRSDIGAYRIPWTGGAKHRRPDAL